MSTLDDYDYLLSQTQFTRTPSNMPINTLTSLSQVDQYVLMKYPDPTSHMIEPAETFAPEVRSNANQSSSRQSASAAFPTLENSLC